jgi:uncharacterized protein YndB with AHSA1/START domain
MAAEPLSASIHVRAEPERVFAYFTEPEAIVRWMGDYAVLDATPGGEFAVDINGVPVRGRYLEVDPPRRLLISWGHAGSERLPPGASTVEVLLTAVGAGTDVRIVHRDLPEPYADGHARGWRHFLARLAIAGAGGDPGPDPLALRRVRDQ